MVAGRKHRAGLRAELCEDLSVCVAQLKGWRAPWYAHFPIKPARLAECARHARAMMRAYPSSQEGPERPPIWTVPVEEARILVRPARVSVVGQY